MIFNYPSIFDDDEKHTRAAQARLFCPSGPGTHAAPPNYYRSVLTEQDLGGVHQ